MRKILAITSVVLLALASALFIMHKKGIIQLPFLKVRPALQTTEPIQRQEDIVEAPEIELTEDSIRLLGIKTSEVSMRPMTKTIRTIGRIEYDEKKLYDINTKIDGWIEKLHVDFEGKHVSKGQKVAEVYSPELIATQNELVNAARWMNSASAGSGDIGGMLRSDAQSILDAARQRLRYWDITDSQIKGIEESGNIMRTLSIYSPENGYVVDKMAVQGAQVMKGEKLFTVADLSTLWILADVYESELHIIRTGQTAIITMSHMPGLEIEAKVDYVYPSLTGATRTLKVRLEISNKGNDLKPKMYTDVDIRIEMGNKLSIPEQSAIYTGQRQVVYVDKGDGFFEPREVSLGMRTSGFVEVISGLSEGERVASTAAFLLDSEAQLKGVSPLSK